MMEGDFGSHKDQRSAALGELPSEFPAKLHAEAKISQLDSRKIAEVVD